MRTKNSIIICVIFMLVMLVLASQSKVYAATVAGNNGIKADIAYYDGLITGKKNVIISINEKNKNEITKRDLIYLYEGNKITDIYNKDGVILANTDKVKTGDLAVTADGKYEIILVGDSNDDGVICDTDDIMTIINDYLGKAKLTGEQKLAANLMNSDELLDTDDIMIMMNRYLGKVENLLSNNLPTSSTEIISTDPQISAERKFITVDIDVIDENNQPIGPIKIIPSEGWTTSASGYGPVEEIVVPTYISTEKTYIIKINQLDKSNNVKNGSQVELKVQVSYNSNGDMETKSVDIIKGNDLVKEKSFEVRDPYVTKINAKILQVASTNSLVSQITPADYGKKINYSVDIPANDTSAVDSSLTAADLKAGTSSTTLSDWRVFYNDGKNVYIILDDYLKWREIPIGTLDEGFAHIWYNREHGNDEEYVKFNEYTNAFIKQLKDTSVWSYLKNGKGAISAIGTPTYEMIRDSYNENPNCKIKLEVDLPDINEIKRIENVELYYPTPKENIIMGYALASAYDGADKPIALIGLDYDGKEGIFIQSYLTNNLWWGIRPVVCLDSSITGTVGETITID